MSGRLLTCAVVFGFAVGCGGGVGDSSGSGGAGGTGANSGSGGSSGKGGSSGNGGASGSGGGGGICALSCELERGSNGLPLCACKREIRECTTDIDCALATNVGTCCPGCTWGYPRTLVEREPCLVPPGKLPPPECTPTGCSGACPAIGCALAVRAMCREGRCEGSYDCLPTQVMALNQCVNKCQTNLDCTLARYTNTCCPTCPEVYPRSLVEAYDCLTPVGSPTPEACYPSPAQCATVDCAAPTECPSVTPACMPDGSCG